jgi:type III restriction enzyme
MESHAARAEQAVAHLEVQLAPRRDVPLLRIPQLKMTPVKNDFSLADITDLDAFRKLGESIAADPSGALRRVTLSARIIEGADGLRRIELVKARAIDRVESPATLFPLEELRGQLVEHLCAAPVVPARGNQRHPAGRIVDVFLAGLGTHAESILSGYMDRAAASLIQVVTEEQRRFVAKPTYGEVVELASLGKVRQGRAETSQDRFSPFKKGIGYEGYCKSLYSQDWFDSSPERDVANILEDADEVVVWVRLQVGDLPILWAGAREYNPDFIAVDRDDCHWLVEVKMDNKMAVADVQSKRQAARRWANHVSADEKVATPWNYILVSEADVKTAKGLWEALKALGV